MPLHLDEDTGFLERGFLHCALKKTSSTGKVFSSARAWKSLVISPRVPLSIIVGVKSSVEMVLVYQRTLKWGSLMFLAEMFSCLCLVDESSYAAELLGT